MFSSYFGTHISRLHLVFQRIERGLYKTESQQMLPIPEKVSFRHIVPARGFEVQEDKVAYVMAYSYKPT